MEVFVGIMQVIVCMAILQVTTSCIYAGFEVALFVTGMLVGVSVAVMQVTLFLLQLSS